MIPRSMGHFLFKIFTNSEAGGDQPNIAAMKFCYLNARQQADACFHQKFHTNLRQNFGAKAKEKPPSLAAKRRRFRDRHRFFPHLIDEPERLYHYQIREGIDVCRKKRLDISPVRH